MRYVALGCDYDGTLATDGRVGDEVIAALNRVRASGRKLILVTGRELDDLRGVFPHLDLFDRVVAENGALLYCPATREERPLGERPPDAFVHALRAQGVDLLSVGRVIVATWQPHETAVLEVIRELGLELQVIFNKGAVMVLPPGVNKGSGFQVALSELRLSPHNAVAVGDAENDHAFLSLSECAVAVANALPLLKERADVVTAEDHGAGVIELIDHLLADDLRGAETRHLIILGTRDDGQEVRLPAYGPTVLCAGPSGSGKSSVATSLVERLAEQGYQFCLIDPEGDYEGLPNTVALGDSERPPSVEEVLQLLADPAQNAVVNLLGERLGDRPAFLAGLLPRLQELRATVGRPHWIVVDEAHHLLPAQWDSAPLVVPQQFDSAILLTIQPDHLAGDVLRAVDTLIALGDDPGATIRSFAGAAGRPSPRPPPITLHADEALVWLQHAGPEPFRVAIEPSRAERRRHRRKYAQGDVGGGKSFYFRGPEGKLNLQAQNLVLFAQLAAGVDDATWLFHLRHGDYSHWFREAIKDEALADAAAAVERDRALSAAASRARIRAAIEERYTLPS